MHLHDLLGWQGPMTHRQFLAWSDWLKRRWDQPDRTDHYLMQIASEVHQTKFKPVPQDKFKIKFQFEEAKRSSKGQGPFPPLTKEKIAEVRSAIHKAQMMGKLAKVKPVVSG